MNTPEKPEYTKSTVLYGLYQKYTPIPLPPLLAHHVERDQEFMEVLIRFLEDVESQLRADFVSAHKMQREMHDIRFRLATYPIQPHTELRVGCFACDRGVEPPKRISEITPEELSDAVWNYS